MTTSSQDRLSHALEQQFGLRNARAEWIRRQTAFSAEELRGLICRTDLCSMSGGTFPWDVHAGHSVTLGVPTLVQVEDVINVSQADPRSAEAQGRARVLQMTLTDGSRDVVAVELEPWGGRLTVKTIPGTKLLLHASARVRRGRLVLRGADFDVLGAPPANVWGPSYDGEVAQGRSAAGLPDTRQMSLARVLEGDDPRNAELVWTGDDADALPLNIGGLADPALLRDDDENGNVANITATPVAPTTAASALPHWTRQDPPSFALERRTGGSGPTSSPYSRVQAAPLSTVPPTAAGAAPPTVGATAPADVIDLVDEDSISRGNHIPEEIPDVPEEMSDGEVVEVYLDSQGGLRVPPPPLGRLAEMRRSSRDGPILVVRAYSPKAERGLQRGDAAAMLAPLDDGSAVRVVRLATSFARVLTLPAGTPPRPAAPTDNLDNDIDAEATRICTAVRGVCGFVSVAVPPDPDAMPVVTDVSATPPDTDLVSFFLFFFPGCFRDNPEIELFSHFSFFFSSEAAE